MFDVLNGQERGNFCGLKTGLLESDQLVGGMRIVLPRLAHTSNVFRTLTAVKFRMAERYAQSLDKNETSAFRGFVSRRQIVNERGDSGLAGGERRNP